MTILMVEDDSRIVEFVRRGLESEGYSVEAVGDGEKALQLGISPTYKLILLDLMLPLVDGKEVCKRLRASGVSTPILMLTAMDTLEDKVSGLRIGADDYLPKPFAFDELLARIEALLRRNVDYQDVNKAELVVGELRLNRDTKEVWRGEQNISLTPKEFTLLEYFMNVPGKVVSRTKILEKVWGYSADPMTNVVEVYIRGLRKKLDEGFDSGVITTVRGFGYKLDVPEAS